MEYSIDQAKNIFDLIKTASPYAYPLLLSLLLPLLWVFLKKILGLSPKVATQIKSEDPWYKKILIISGDIIMIKGQRTDWFIFYLCILLFIVGGITLKYGEFREEEIRQKALGLKKYMETRKYTDMQREYLEKNVIKNNYMLDKILYNHPSEFVAFENDIYCIDTASVDVVKKYVYPLLDNYLETKLKSGKTIAMSDLWQKDTVFNIRNYFNEEMVYDFIGRPYNKGKYKLDVVDDKTVITKGDSLK